MPSNQTPNYQLNQWSADDRVQRADFNADNAKIDAALAALQAAVATIPKIHIGTYVGNGEWGWGNPTHLTLPFEAKFVAITSGDSAGYFIRGGNGICNWQGGSASNWALRAEWDGCQLSWFTTGNAEVGQQLNRKDAVYTYIAIG